MSRVRDLKEHILLDTAVLACIYWLSRAVLRLLGLEWMNWVKWAAALLLFAGVLAGTVQLLRRSTGRTKKIAFGVLTGAEAVVMLCALFVTLLVSDRQEIVKLDGEKMVRETHSVLLSNWIKYYDYQNPFVRKIQERIYVACDDSPHERLYTIYYDEDGNFVRREE